MKFKSIQSLLSDAGRTLERFPLAMACACVGTVAAIALWDQASYEHRNLWFLLNLFMTCVLGIPLFLSAKVFIETHAMGKEKARIFQGICLVLLIVYFFVLPKHLKEADSIRYALLESDMHLLVAIAPFLFFSKITNAFWQYNRILFLRIILAFIYSNTIFLGLTIALGATGYLFSIKIDPRIYAHLWLSTIGIFNTWFFLSGVPDDIQGLQDDQSYPEGLRIFTQFILIPLVLLYLFILYLYMIKIIFTLNLPHGWLSSFIIGVAVFGILTLLLVHPLTDRQENSWFRIYRKYFYLALFPLIVLMAIAISRRILDFGVTEDRYLVLIFTAWLLLIAIRFTLRPNSNIRSIPLTLFLLIAVSVWGPWSAVQVSKYSQMCILKGVLTKNGILVGNQLRKVARPLEARTNSEVINIVEYLVEILVCRSWTHGLILRQISILKNYLPGNL